MRKFLRGGRLILAMLLVLVLGPWNQEVTAQSPMGLDEITLTDLMKSYAAAGGGGSAQVTSPLDRSRGASQPSGIVAEQGRQAQVYLPPSAIEKDYSLRAGQELSQFGYDVFANAPVGGGMLNGAVGEDYLLGIDDEIVVTFYGQSSRTISSRIDREGRLVLPEMMPITAAGRRFGEFRRELEARVENSMIGTEVFVSVGAVRMISVVVAGEVMHPGLQQLTGLSTVMDALYAAGGIRKTGTLRRITVERNGQRMNFDAYRLLIDGEGGGLGALVNGDRIIVPPLGATVAVAGAVKRPAIFELAGASSSQSGALNQMLGWAGGAIRPQGNRYLRQSLDAEGRDNYSEIDSKRGASLGSGDILRVQMGSRSELGGVSLVGNVRVPGRRPLALAPTVAALIGHGDQAIATLAEQPYLLFAALWTTDEHSRARYFQPINLEGVIKGRDDYPLKNGDVLVILGEEEIRFPMSSAVQTVLAGKKLQGAQLERAAEQGAAQELLKAEEMLLAGQKDELLLQLGGSLTGDKAALQRRGESLLAQSRLTQQAGGGRAASEDEMFTAAQQAQIKRILGDSDGDRPGLEVRRLGGRGDGLEWECRSLDELAALIASERAGRFANAMRAVREVKDLPSSGVEPVCPKTYEDHPGLLTFVLEHMVVLSGEVRLPGAYPVAGTATMAEAVAFAGGTTREFDPSNLELSRTVTGPDGGNSRIERRRLDLNRTSMQKLMIEPGDMLRFNPVVSERDVGGVLLAGEFRHPGFYDIARGERLSQAIQRAGGLTDQAYPYGAVFSRERIKRQEEENYRRFMRDLQDSMLGLAAMGRSDGGEVNIAALTSLVNQLKETEAVGRIVVEADPTVLQVRPELDTILESGDTIYMPKRTNVVTVTGEVLNPGAMSFIPGQKVDDYVEMAGGSRRYADDDRIFVVYPNGVAKPLQLSFWNYESTQIAPGSTIVVPRDPAPFDLLTFTRDIASLFSDLAVTAASLAAIDDN